MEKDYLDAQQLLDDSFALAANIFESGFRPTVIIAVWPGGAPIGLAVQEFLSFTGVHTDHITIRTSSYQNIDERSRNCLLYTSDAADE